MIFSVKWVPSSLEIMEGILQVKTCYLTISLLLYYISLAAEEGFNPHRKHTDNNKNILITHTRWQLSEV